MIGRTMIVEQLAAPKGQGSEEILKSAVPSSFDTEITTDTYKEKKYC
jgi:hypothetical protein